MGRVRWKARSPLCVDRGLLDPGIQRGSGRGPAHGSFRFLPGDIRMLAGEARHTASDRAGFLGSHPEANAARTRLKHHKIKPLKLDTPGGGWTPRGVQSGPRSPEARGIHLDPRNDPTMTLSFAPDRIETWPLAKLQPYARNAKAHGADQVAKIAASMAEFGWTVPCLVAEDGELIAGHGRVLAATQLGLTEAPVIVLGHLTETQRRAYRLADNKLTELGTWDEALLSAELNDLLAEDFDLSLVGFSDGELDKLLAYVPEGDGQDGGAGGSVPPVTIPEPPRNPASRTGDLWILGDHRLLCGDSTSAADVRRLMNGERAILFATDPPYLVDYDGSNHPTRNKDWSASYGTTWDDSSQGAELYDGFIATAVAEAIAGDAAWYCWHASRRQAMLEACWEKAGAFVHQQIIWVKDRGVLTRSHYLWRHEPCFMGWRRPNRPPKVAEETLPSTWALPSFAKDERPDHPTPKPLDAFGIPMRQHVARGGLCYEPFSGSGSQIMAGEANGRRVFAMEISPAYVDVAVERWQAETGKDAILDGDGRTFAQVKAERLGDVTDTPDTDAEPEPARKRQTAA